MLSNEQQKKLNLLMEENRGLKAELDKVNLKYNSLEGALTYQTMTIEAYKNSIDVLSATNRDLKDLLQLYNSNTGQGQSKVQGEFLEKRKKRKTA